MVKNAEERPAAKEIMNDSFMISVEKEYETYLFNQTSGSLSSLISSIRATNIPTSHIQE
jgi:hypothetical protein